jgi:hypothetical protein
MRAFLDNLKSPAWWLGIVVVGIVINLISAYLKPRFDSVLARWSVYWATRSTQQREERLHRIALLRDKLLDQIFATSIELRHRIRALTFLLMGSILICGALFEKYLGGKPLGSIVALFGAILCILFGMAEHQAGTRMENELKEARGEKRATGKQT